jgi:hypothetical protein
LLLLPLSSQAVSISAFRIYLDSDKPTTAFTIHNQDVQAQDCRLKLTHYNFDANSDIYNVPADTIPDNSAQDWIRFSPKEFQLTPANSQTIRFSLRRKANSEPAEYRSYLVVDCGVAKKIGEEESLINIKPKLLHNVPVIVRTGKLEASIHVANVKEDNEYLSFTVERSGTRSIYADVELINKKNNEVISSQTGFSIYPESERFPFKLGRKGISLEDIKIRVTENIHFGGDLVFERDVSEIVQDVQTQ